MGLLGNIKDFIRTNIITYLLFVYIFIVSSIIVNIVMLLTAIFIWPFNKELYRKVNYHLAYLVWSRKYILLLDTYLNSFMITSMKKYDDCPC